jgi:hypothetical protein
MESSDFFPPKKMATFCTSKKNPLHSLHLIVQKGFKKKNKEREIKFASRVGR